MQQMQQMQQMHHQLQQMRQHMQQQQYQQQMQQLQQSMSDQDDPQKPAPQQAPRLKDPRAESAGRAAASVAPAGPPRGYFFRPARENGSHTKQTESRSQFSVVSLAAPLLPASAASLANRSAMEQACILVNVVLLSVLTGIVAAFLVRQLT
ncbi:hypothetical protein V5799_015706 [Amblyomma americanum]|uniref:Uncharacterized protein n=1 Tax=Amblyomma americanum TaxID=6943 RepID=A0AAQ4F8H3_AMBAM